MDDVVLPGHLLPSYKTQSDSVRARFDSLKAREVILQVSHLHKSFDSGPVSTWASFVP